MKNVFLLLVVIMLIVFNFSLALEPVLADGATDKAQAGLKASADTAGFSTAKAEPAEVIGKALNILISVLGIIFVILVVYGGVTWMTATGNADQVKKARSMIIEGALGMAVTLASYSLASYVVEKASSATQ